MSGTKKDAGSLHFSYGNGFMEIRNVEKVKNHIELLKKHPFADYKQIAIT
jgi:hypothetical protein